MVGRVVGRRRPEEETTTAESRKQTGSGNKTTGSSRTGSWRRRCGGHACAFSMGAAGVWSASALPRVPAAVLPTRCDYSQACYCYSRGEYYSYSISSQYSAKYPLDSTHTNNNNYCCNCYHLRSRSCAKYFLYLILCGNRGQTQDFVALLETAPTTRAPARAAAAAQGPRGPAAPAPATLAPAPSLGPAPQPDPDHEEDATRAPDSCGVLHRNDNSEHYLAGFTQEIRRGE